MEEADFSKFKEEVKAKNDIVQVISRYIPLDKKGKTYWGRCPFHGEKTPSFAVNEIGQYYHCFGCKASGDIFSFIQEVESVDFNGALEILAEKAGLEIPKFSANNAGKDEIEHRKRYKDRLIELMKAAAKHYNENLFSGKCSEAWDYLFKVRKVPQETAVKFGMGASVNYQEMIDYLKNQGFTEQEMLDSGVAKIKNNRLYDAVGERLVFPNIDIFGNVIGFCGRILKKSDFAKYLNTAETLLFSKGKTLYGINLVKKKKQQGSANSINYMIIVEGQMDTVSLHKAGFDTAVASMGTALTADQAKLIKRFTDNVFICYDGDFAGQKATIRGLEILREEGLNVKVVDLPDGMDPDDVINKLGVDGFRKLLKAALPLVEFKLELAKRNNNLTTRDGKAKYIEDALEILKGLDEVQKEVYISLVSEVSGTNIDFLRRQLTGVAAVNAGKESAIMPTREAVKNVDSAVIKAQKFVLSAMINLRPYAHFDKPISYIFSGEAYVKLAEAVDLSAGSVSLEQMLKRVREFAGEELTELASEVASYIDAYGAEESDQKYFKDSLWIVYKNYLDGRLEELNRELIGVSDNEERKKILTEIASVLNIIKLKKVEL